MELKKEHGYYWPDINLESGFRRYVSRAPDMDKAIKHCKKKRIAVQAGGHCGVWPIRMASQFEHVYTFEPDIDNFRALMANVKQKNIYAFRAALGLEPDFVGLHKNSKNTGGHWIEGKGGIPVLSLDHCFDLPALDFLCLDIEGYELHALRGAMATIEKFSPVIMFEDNGNFQTKGGYDPALVYDFMRMARYNHVESVGDDKIWTRN